MKHANPTPVALVAEDRLPALLTAGAALLPLLLLLPSAFSMTLAVVALAVAALTWRHRLPKWLKFVLALGMLALVIFHMGKTPGRDTGCALLAAMLVIKPSETSTIRDARSLLGFALFAPFAAFLLNQGMITTLLGLCVVILAWLTLQRLADTESGIRPPALRKQLASIARMLYIGLPLALIAFLLFPRLPTPLWGIPTLSQPQLGLSDSMTPGNWLDLMVDESTAFRVTFADEVPSPEQMYWRGPTLWYYDGKTWTRPMLGTEPSNRAMVTFGDTEWRYEIEYEPTDHYYLVALDLITALPPNTHLTTDYTLTSREQLINVTRWQMTSSAPEAFEPGITAKSWPWLQLPSGFNPRTQQLAQTLRQRYGDDDQAIVRHVMQWITNEFSYTLDIESLPGRNAIDEFLFDQKQGYCEHFSSAFVVLMRSAGIPARVVTGYAGGFRNTYGNYWIVQRMDAHAWAEVWLPQRGWVRADPTAAVAPERILNSARDRLRQGSQSDFITRFQTLLEIQDWLKRNWNDTVLSFDAGRQGQLLKPFGIERLNISQLSGLFACSMAIALIWMIGWLRRRERNPDPVLRAWHKLGRRYGKFGLERQMFEPALEWAQRVAANRPEAAHTLIPLSRRFVEWRYAAGDENISTLIRDLRKHRP